VRPAFSNYECIWRPNVDVYESNDEIIVLADMAGLNKEELHIEVDRKKVKIAGVRKAIRLLQNARYCQAKFRMDILSETLFCPLPWIAVGKSVLCRRILMVRINKLPANKAASHFDHFGK